jgi:hypothetical protein
VSRDKGWQRQHSWRSKEAKVEEEAIGEIGDEAVVCSEAGDDEAVVARSRMRWRCASRLGLGTVGSDGAAVSGTTEERERLAILKNC